MAHDDNDGRRTSAIDYATHSAVAGALTQEHPEEVETTLRELLAYFGEPAIVAALVSIGIKLAQGQQSPEVLRGYCFLVIESDRPRLTAQLVGKLVGIETSIGKRIRLSDLARSEGISKQAVSKRLANYAARLGLSRPDSTAAARKSHQLMNRRNYAE